MNTIYNFVFGVIVGAASILFVYEDILTWYYDDAAICCTTDTECMKLCAPEDVNCDGGPQ